MFTIMDNNQSRKRARFVNSPQNECLQAPGPTTLSIGGQSFIISDAGSSSSSLPANILLSLCDDNSDESEEYIIDSSVLQQIKQETNVGTQTTASSNTQQQSASAQFLTTATVPQYRIINQSSGKSLLNHNNNTSFTSTTAPTTTTLVSSIPAMQLSSGCEIYVIKEVVEQQPPKQLLAETVMPSKLVGNNGNTIKLEPISPTPATAAGTLQILRTTSSATSSNIAQAQPQQQQSISSNTCQNTIVLNNTNLSPQQDQESVKRGSILEAYKKRDDKRRATHNEVERRRRDKINSWIFKLKEMLPSDMNNVIGTGSGIVATNNLNAGTQSSPSTRLLVQQGSTTATTTRTPPSDSKSQILIKACEYIKSMQEEIQSLRECLTENENLRLSNQMLQDELNNLRNKQQQQTRQHKNLNNNNPHSNNNNNNNNNSNALLLSTQSDDDECELTLNSLNTTYANVQLFSPNSNLTAMIGGPTTMNTTTTSGAVTPSSGIIYTKRELIIRDYVD
ncbi:upstream transcription factor usf [Haematobia irritans]|uniref:upstream transcription factor usf n=1 Tax=Haematobia irritans TaxID=7368 RepID=UPI003F501307